MSMKAVNYAAPFKVEVQDVPIPGIEHPDDVIVKVTTAAICGSDLHMYEGRTGAQPGTSPRDEAEMPSTKLTSSTRNHLWP